MRNEIDMHKLCAHPSGEIAQDSPKEAEISPTGK